VKTLHKRKRIKRDQLDALIHDAELDRAHAQDGYLLDYADWCEGVLAALRLLRRYTDDPHETRLGRLLGRHHGGGDLLRLADPPGRGNDRGADEQAAGVAP